MVERQFEVVERQPEVPERRFGPFRLNLITYYVTCCCIPVQFSSLWY